MAKSRMKAIQDLLHQIPPERLAPDTRQRLVSARASAEPEEARLALRAALTELLRRGELVRVAAEGSSGPRGSFFLLRGTSQLLDLGGLAGAELRAAEREAVEREATEETGTRPDGPVRPVSDGDAVGDASGRIGSLLEAMESAQDLAVGDPRADEPGILVDRILTLLQSYVPAVSLYAQLNGHPGTRRGGNLLPPVAPTELALWMRHRRPGQALWIPDPAELPASLRARLGGPAAGAPVTAVVPIWSPIPVSDSGRTADEVGLLYVVTGGDWTSAALLKLAERLSNFVTRRWRCQRDVNRRVLTDSLTGIHNRAFFDSHFPLELERARRGNFPLTLVIGDLDRFKTINDTHGHQCGDAVLREVARQVQGMLRRIDYVCRIGGEEFALILPFTSLEEAREALARMIGRPFRVPLPPELGVGVIAVTMSYGAVTYPEAGASAGELHRKADSMLYQAKELGRNRCCLWNPDGRHLQLLPTPPAAEA